MMRIVCRFSSPDQLDYIHMFEAVCEYLLLRYVWANTGQPKRSMLSDRLLHFLGQVRSFCAL